MGQFSLIVHFYRALLSAGEGQRAKGKELSLVSVTPLVASLLDLIFRPEPFVWAETVPS